MPEVMWDNASQAILERSLDDSANRRIVLAESFLASDEMLRRAVRIMSDIRIDKTAIERNMSYYGPFAAMERILMAAVAAGADRQEAHEWLRQNSLQAWQQLRDGAENPLQRLVLEDGRIGRYLTEAKIADLMNVSAHTGTASRRARALAQRIREVLAST
jgi:adenylosuccinate lyase